MSQNKMNQNDAQFRAAPETEERRAASYELREQEVPKYNQQYNPYRGGAEIAPDHQISAMPASKSADSEREPEGKSVL
eukprot:ANDGO_02533.mRNA.1 hypothetical protein